MARFNCIPPVTGNLGPVVIYEMYGRYFMRTTSSLTRERVKKDPAFRRTRELAGLLAKASRMAAQVYSLIPVEQRSPGLYRKLTGEAMYWLCNQWTAADVLEYLQRMYLQPVARKLAKAKATAAARKPGQARHRANEVPAQEQLSLHVVESNTPKNRPAKVGTNQPPARVIPIHTAIATKQLRPLQGLVRPMMRDGPARQVAGIESS